MTVTPDDKYLHRASDSEKGLCSDNFWFSFCDHEADVFGINHRHASLNKGYPRFSTYLVIDGIPQPWSNKVPLADEEKFDKPTDDNMAFEFVKPLEEIRITFDGPKYGYAVTFKGRFPVFDYKDSIKRNPLAGVVRDPGTGYYGGHFEQELHYTGDFEVRGGPRQGVRRLDSYSHRDHSWTYRFANESLWEYPAFDRTTSLGHFWPSIQTDTMHLNAFGHIGPTFRQRFPDAPQIGGFLSNKNGSRAIRDANCEVRFEDDVHIAMSFRYGFVFPDGEEIHVRTGRKYAHSVNGLMRGENDAECRLECYESFFDFEVEETGESGYGCAEYSITPPFPRWRY
ncbi:MAG: hypothetical protein QF515_15145 [Pseudomonadales bacterium]|nr:hypothetical protein [Pseudomonadales bacterium]